MLALSLQICASFEMKSIEVRKLVRDWGGSVHGRGDRMQLCEGLKKNGIGRVKLEGKMKESGRTKQN